MGSEWPEVPFETLAADEKGAIAIGPFGSRMKADVYVSAGIPVIRGMNITGTRWLKDDWVYVSQEFADGIKNCVVQPGDLVFPHRGAIGEVALIEPQHGQMVLSTSMMKFRPDQGKANPLFLYYYFRSARGRQEILRYSSQVGTPGVGQPLTSMRKFLVPDVPLPRQNVIADILGTLDDKIELNRQINRTLEAIARAIFKSWFVDFEPVKAKAAGRTSFRGMPQSVFDQLPDRFTDTELGPVPEGWEYVPIGNLVDVIGGGTPSTKNPDFWEGGEYAFCTPKDLSRLSAPVLLDTERHITQAGVDKISSGQVPVGAVILSSRAPIGYLALADTPVSVNQGIIAMVAGEIPNAYILLWTEANMEVIKSRAGGSTFAEISKKNFRPIPALRPDDATLSGFGDLTKPFFGCIASNEREAQTLAAIRDTLLPKLISGELRVPVAVGGAHGA